MGDLGGVAYWALAGLVVVTANPALRAAELHYVLEQSRSAGLFHTAAFERVRDDGRRAAPCLGPAGFRWEGEVICAVAAND